MKSAILFVSLLCTFCCSLCQNTKKPTTQDTNFETDKIRNQQLPNFNYSVKLPENWITVDTVMGDGLRIKFLIAPQILDSDLPRGNVLISFMNGDNLNYFTTKNIENLKSTTAGIVILERGNLDSCLYGCEWFTYTKEQNGKIREMINYIIPYRGYAYMITCGVNRGVISKYRLIFDQIAQSIKVLDK